VLEDIANRFQLDVLLVQEPYVVRGSLSGVPLGVSTFFDRSASKPWTAVVVFDRRLDVMGTRFCTPHAVGVGIRRRSGEEWFLVSAYAQCSDRDDEVLPFLVQLEDIATELYPKKVLMGIDANARSLSWHSDITNRKGELFEDFIVAADMSVMNRPGQAPTHESGSNIDITIASASAVDQVQNWQVYSDASPSDHSLITYDISQGNAGNEAGRFRTRFKSKKADWSLFRVELAKLLRDNRVARAEVTDADTRAAELMGAIGEAARLVLGHVSPKARNQAPWWNEQVGKAWRKARQLRNKYLRVRRNKASRTERGREKVARARQELRRAEKKFKLTARDTRLRKFREFVSVSSRKDIWGFWQRLLRGKVTSRQPFPCVRDANGTFCHTFAENARVVLDGLVPDGQPLPQTQRQGDASPNTRGYSVPEHLFSSPECFAALKRMKLRKAPGPDGITAEILRESWPVIGDAVMKLFNQCAAEGVFPRAWKTGELILIPKTADADPHNLKTYRPITLLPVMGKWLERLVERRLRAHIREVGWLDDGQFGFTAKKCTEGAISAAVRYTEETSGEDKYVLGLFLDIKGAFDNAPWHLIVRQFERAGCEPWLLAMLDSYFADRSAEIIFRTDKVGKTLSKGCPQGSILGPLCWNMLFDTFLKLKWPQGVKLIAYADDAALFIRARSARELQAKIDFCLRLVESWGAENELTFSAAKTQALWLKGRLRKSPSIVLGGQHIQIKADAQYLGVKITEGLRFDDHVSELRTKVRGAYGRFTRIARKSWGPPFEVARILYRALVESVATYAASVYEGRVRMTGKTALSFRSAQRLPLLSICHAFSTTSNIALCVVAGVLPLDWLVVERAAAYRARVGEVVKIGEHEINPRTMPARTCRRRIREAVVSMWNAEWTGHANGRVTFSFLPDVGVRDGMSWLQPNKYMTWMITGHGPFTAYYERFNITAEPPRCRCGGPRSDVQHILDECAYYAPQLEKLKGELSEHLGRPYQGRPDWLSTEFAFRRFSDFAQSVFAPDPDTAERENVNG